MSCSSTDCHEDDVTKNMKFDNRFLSQLPVDESRRLGARKVVGACYSLVEPTPVENPRLVALSESALRLIDIHVDGETVNDEVSDQLAEYFSGNRRITGSQTAAHVYSGHQFGQFSGQLGDGCVIYLGEVKNSSGERWEIQLKGAGCTPFSRRLDGRKVLRSSIREFLCSEAMYYLGVPTTRAGTLITSNTKVIRDMFYDGNRKLEHCAVVLRIAQTFLRFGSFEIFRSSAGARYQQGPCAGKNELLHQLLRYTINHFFPTINQNCVDDVQRYMDFYKEISLKTAQLVAKWQSLGFCHGVLNTDNMSILGLTIDYGPFAFMDWFDPQFISNKSDENGRYAFQKQPEICRWNLQKLAEAIEPALPLFTSKHILDTTFDRQYNKAYTKEMRKKLGLVAKQLPTDLQLVEELLETMHATAADFTNTFHLLNNLHLPCELDFEATREATISSLLSICACLNTAKILCEPTYDEEQLEMFQSIGEENPSFMTSFFGDISNVIRLDLARVERLKQLVGMDDDTLRSCNSEKWEKWMEMYVDRLRKETSHLEDENQLKPLIEVRRRTMAGANPKYVLRNHLVQAAIDEAEKGNFVEVKNLLRRLKQPFVDEHGHSFSAVDDSHSLDGGRMYNICGIPYNSLPSGNFIGLKVS